MATAISTKIDSRELIAKLGDLEYKLNQILELLQDAIWDEEDDDCPEEPKASDYGGDLFGEDGNLESAECRALHMGGGYETDSSSES